MSASDGAPSGAIRVVDAHVHFYDKSKVKISWIAGAERDFKLEPGTMDRDWGEADLRKEQKQAADRYSVSAGVFVEVHVDKPSRLAEAKFALGLAADKESQIQGVVAAIPVPQGAEAVKAFLDALRVGGKLPPGLKGGRVNLFGQPKDVMLSEKYASGLNELTKNGLHWEWGCNPDYLPGVIATSKKFPGTRFVLCHLGMNGGLGCLKGGLEEYKGYLDQLATCPNVYVKMGAIEEWNVKNPKPIIRHALKAFGFDRCIAEGNWFVAQGQYANSFDQLGAVLQEMKAPEKARAAVYAKNAENVYRL